MKRLFGDRRSAIVLLTAVLLLLVGTQAVLLAQNTGAQPEGAFLNLVNWIGNVIAPVGAGLAIAAGLVSYISGRGVMRYVITALGCLAISGVTRLLEFWITQGGGGVS